MKIKNALISTSILLITTTMSFAASSDNVKTSAKTSSEVKTSNTISNTTHHNSFIKPFANTLSSITNKDNTWGPQDRTGQWYLGVDVNGIATGGYYGPNSKGANSGWNGIIGYNINKYLAVQYNQFATYNGMFGGLGEGVINVSNSTMFTPYAAGGAGWANLAGEATGAWDIGGGLKLELSKNVQASFDYRYIQTIAPSYIVGPSGRAGINMIGAGLTWFFGEK